MSTPMSTLLDRIAAREARIGVIGLGYVGLPLAVEFANHGFDVTGFDVDESKVAALNRVHCYIPDVPQAERAAAALKSGQLVILESTTYPGTTDEVALPMLEAKGLVADRDFFLAFSPERVDPGNQTYTTRNIPKIVGGYGPASTRVATALYSHVVSAVVPVTSTRVAEMVKLLKNTFRAVNIGLVNELAQMCHALDIDVWEVIEAAKTKPFGFMPFYPGPGLGGHCIPIDPHYLSWKARQVGFECRFIELA